jgi:hypothetical protein
MTEVASSALQLVKPDEHFRLYIDESGDHVFRHLDKASHRYLCLLGCWFRRREYRLFQSALDEFKRRHLPHDPDDPVILHREDITNRRRCFWRLRNPEAAQAFDRDLLQLISDADFRIFAAVIDKAVLKQSYDVPAHPYHLGLGFLLQRYCGYLNYFNRRGDVMAESRGGQEDRLLRDSYTRVHSRGAWMVKAPFFQRALTSEQLKIKPKSANIAGLQLADLLAHPIRQSILIEHGQISGPLGPFADQLLGTVDGKYNRHFRTGQVQGYGKVLFPRDK